MNKNFYTYCYFGNLPGLSNILKEQGVDINERNDSGQTGLEIACETRRVDAVKFLLLNGADPTLKNEDGVSVMDKLGEYDESIQSLLQGFSKGEFEEESRQAKSETNKALLIKKKIKAKVDGELGLKVRLSRRDINVANEKIQRIMDSLAGKMSEDEVAMLVAEEMGARFFPLMIIRDAAASEDGKSFFGQLGKEYHEVKTFDDFCNEITDLILKADIDEELLDDLIDVIDACAKAYFRDASIDSINLITEKVAQMIAIDTNDMLANGEIEELPHKE